MHDFRGARGDGGDECTYQDMAVVAERRSLDEVGPS